ncbi:MAG: FAD:protein FMN transferase [Brevundimonas sp.]|nr:MAG: FAD:protein FMN transferase [Brevundimonas sp.]
MGTTWSVRLVPTPGQDRALYQAAIEDELAGIVSVFSHWNPRSELSRFNAAEPGFYAVSEEFWTVLNAAMDIADETDGAVDPTLGALVDLWGFGPPGPRPATVPWEDEIAAALAVSGWNRLRLNRDARAIQQIGGLKLDLSGLAKGHAVDCVSDRLFELGAASHLVEIGGELRGRGVKPDTRPWWTELEQAPGAPGPRTIAALFDMAVATSGDWIRSYEVAGKAYSHTIEGRTGRPIENGVASVTVLADTAFLADAYATALMVMGGADGPAYAEAAGLAAAVVTRTDAGLIETISPAFAAMLEEGAGE